MAGVTDERTDGQMHNPSWSCLVAAKNDIKDESNQMTFEETYSTYVLRATVKKTPPPLMTFCFLYNWLCNIKNFTV